MDGSLHVTALPVASSIVVKVGGEIDVVTASCFLQALDRALLTPCSSVQLDLSEVTFFSAAGVNALMKAHRQAAERSLDLSVVAASRQVVRVMNLTGADRLVRVCAPAPETTEPGRRLRR